MSSSSSVQSGQPAGGVWASMAPYVAPPLAASAAIVPTFYGFAAKSAQQIGKPIPRMSILEALKGGFKAAPTIGIIVGTQMVSQATIEKVFMKYLGSEDKKPSFSFMLISSIVVGGISAPALAVFNGQTLGRTAMQSLKEFPWKQRIAIVSRETSFLFSLRISDPISDAMKRVYGNNKSVEYGSAFISGAMGSIIGHPADTALTRWQNEMKVESFRQSMKGAPMKALAVGGFSVLYKAVQDILKSK